MKDLMLISIPIMLVLMALEISFSVWKKKGFYNFKDTLSNLSQGVGQQAIGIFIKVVALGGYHYVWENYRFTDLDTSNALHWLLVVALTDLCFYCFHIMGHRVNIFIGFHTVHHQSEQYNMSVALRQSWFAPVFRWVFYLPLALVGAPVVMFVGSSVIILLYQFWLHTRVIDKMGPLEWFMVTPSHHRVHHGKNPQYLDKNCAAVFIIWDRLFGTFEPEVEEVKFGLQTPFDSINPLYANTVYFEYLIARMKKMDNLSDKLKLWIAAPEWLSDQERAALGEKVAVQKPAKKSLVNWEKNYVVVQFIALLGFLVYGLKFHRTQDAIQNFLIVSVIVWGLMNLAAIVEKKKWASKSELIRVVLIGTYTGVALAF
ncbi:MAG: sterol desaturase family protein [Bacteriovoracaceae bacterium]|jgi:alkylglycerol monooxygenase|nr:sterol desaturase family protein [Bacteriovoracaceae bacterium]